MTTDTTTDTPSTSYDNQHLLEQIALAYLKEKKHTRRWRIFCRLFFLMIILGIGYYCFSNINNDTTRIKPHVALIDLKGEMSDDSTSNADNIAEALAAAYHDKGTRAILFRINSPGGSPVQADYIYNEIKRYQALHPKIKIYAVCTDMCASAAYYAASAANEIYANPASLVGSIGVVYSGFGYVDIMKKIGVERRLHTAGKYKGFMDPFSPDQPQEEALLQNMLDTIHQQFEDRVKSGRGDRLKITPDLFTGLFWTGAQAKDLGLIDGFGSAGSVARDVIHLHHIIDYTITDNYFNQFARQLGIGMSSELLLKMKMPQELRL